MPDGGAAAVAIRRSVWKLLRALVRNPLEALPIGIYSAPMVVARVGGTMRVHVADPELIHAALVEHADCLIKSDDLRRALGPALGQGLLTADGAHWRWQRRSVSPAFQHGRLVGCLPAMIAAAEATRDGWLARPGVVDAGQAMMRTTFQIIVETMLSGAGGIDATRVERSITDYLQPAGWVFALSLLRAPAWVPYPGRARSRRASSFIRGAVMEMIAARRTGPVREDLVSLLLEAEDPESGRRMADGEVADNLITFITAGHETTAQGLAWTLHLLTGAPEVEARMLAEIAEVTGGGALTAEHVGKLTYVRQVFSEAMRLFPPAPIVARKVVRAFTLGGVALPEGTALYVPIHAVHRHALLWEQPERFDPERFSQAGSAGRHRYAFMPFGAGPRVCIGSAFAMMEAVAVLAVLVPAVRARRVGTESPVASMKVTLRPMRPLMISVVGRRPGTTLAGSEKPV